MFSSHFFASTYFASTYWAEGTGVTPTVTSGGGAVPVRGWNGREYWDGQRGNVKTIHRPREVILEVELGKLSLRAFAKLNFIGKPTRPNFPRPVDESNFVEIKPHQRIWPPLRIEPVSLRLNAIAYIGLLESKYSKRLKVIRSQSEVIETQLQTSKKELEHQVEELRYQLQQASEEIIGLEDQLLLGVI